MEPAAPHPEPAAMETETKVSIKTMKEVIRSAGLATVADVLPTLADQSRSKLLALQVLEFILPPASVRRPLSPIGALWR